MGLRSKTQASNVGRRTNVMAASRNSLAFCIVLHYCDHDAISATGKTSRVCAPDSFDIQQIHDPNRCGRSLLTHGWLRAVPCPDQSCSNDSFTLAHAVDSDCASGGNCDHCPVHHIRDQICKISRTACTLLCRPDDIVLSAHRTLRPNELRRHTRVPLQLGNDHQRVLSFESNLSDLREWCHTDSCQRVDWLVDGSETVSLCQRAVEKVSILEHQPKKRRCTAIVPRDSPPGILHSARRIWDHA